MSKCFEFMDKSSVAESGSHTWTNQVAVSTPLDVSSNGDCSMTDSINDSYATAIDENETQYLSVLESSNDVTLEDLHNLTIGNPKLMEQENLQTEPVDVPEDSDGIDAGDHQVVIFNMEGSDDLYGIQFAQDEDGNMQKYQFQVRTNEEGQFEAIPETIQLLAEENNASEDLPPDSSQETHESVDNQDKTLEEVVFETEVFVEEELDENSDTPIYMQDAENVIEEIQTENENQTDEGSETVFVFIKSEPTAGANQPKEELENQLDDTQIFDNCVSEYAREDEAIDVKPSLIEASLTSNIKQEYNIMQDQIAQEVECQREAEEIIYEASNIAEEHSQEILSQDYDAEDAVASEEDTVLEYRHFESQNIEICEDDSRTAEAVGLPSKGLYGNEEGLDEEQAVEEQYVDGNDSDSEGYEMEDGLHVTAEGDISEQSSPSEYQSVETIYEEPHQLGEEQITPLNKQIDCQITNVLKQPMNTSNMDNFSNKTILYYMITNPDQKENVISLPLCVKPNPRSLLKNVGETENACEGPPKAKEKTKDPRKSLSHRRFARSSEFAQAKLFNNFIDKTTISQAPIRQIRLPRKQEIKPVDTRRDEEIIVKEVMVSSKGFIENVHDRLNSKDKLEITSIVELTDSDEDPSSTKNGRKKKKKNLRTSKQRSTPHPADSTVIEILQSDDESVHQSEPSVDRSESSVGQSRPAETTAKRGRGRPKKGEAAGVGTVGVDGAKRPRGRPPKTPKKKSRTESSEPESDQGKTEIKCPHCAKSFPSNNSLSTHIQHHNLENSLKNAKTQQIEYKYKCDTCHSTFKNNILLKRHTCQNTSKPKCGVCSKTINNAASLEIHIRSHVKENMMKNTTTVTISPKKLRPSTVPKFKSPMRPATFKCKHCSKVCSSQTILAAHERTHKTYSCATCKAAFSSKLLLDTHLRISCVKTASPKDKRLSFKIRKSYVSSPRRGRISVVPTRTSTVPTRTSTVPTRTSTVPSRMSVLPRKAPSKVPSKTPVMSGNYSAVPGSSSAVPSGRSRTSVVPTRASGMYGKPLDLKLQCALCLMKFSTMTALFKHEVKDHNVSTPDKKVLLPDKKQLHKPLHEHGGIPMPCRLNKFFQGFRKKLESDSTVPVSDFEKNDEK
ncbi:unnamed protein product [Phaedon cochleariae]|uniref:C2H2-type domain-containing protein n=1 Tax=Phaedon cochleariae TaxID=80249 RepID=A0A9P0DW84_PHACE|nr:unnamed protein product [Phaedon cochleariae]